MCSAKLVQHEVRGEKPIVQAEQDGERLPRASRPGRAIHK